MWVANAKATHIFSAKILAYMPYLVINNDTLTNNIVSFEQLGPEQTKEKQILKYCLSSVQKGPGKQKVRKVFSLKMVENLPNISKVGILKVKWSGWTPNQRFLNTGVHIYLFNPCPAEPGYAMPLQTI